MASDFAMSKSPAGAQAGLPPQSVRGRVIGGFALLTIILVVVVAGSAWLTREHHYQLSEMERWLQPRKGENQGIPAISLGEIVRL